MMNIPRRLDVNDADFDSHYIRRLVVLLDGEDQAGFATGYDLDAGTVTRAKKNERGEVYVDGDAIAMETVSGKVEVSLTPAE